VNEAMLCGCAVAASDHVGAARDLITHGRTGFVYPCADVDALTALLRRATRGDTKLSDMGRAARARMESWSPRENIEATVAAVARAVSRIEDRPAQSSIQATAQREAAESSGSVPQKLSK